jgi:drug/metabolite transporter (DMT)-like permease
MISAVLTAMTMLLLKKTSSTLPSDIGYCLASIFVGLPILAYAADFSQFSLCLAEYWKLWLLTGILNFIAMRMMSAAIDCAEISLVAPLLGTFPVFALLTSFFFLHETLTGLGILGVCVSALGVYVLSLSNITKPLVPIRRLLTERGPQLMLGVAIVWSISAVLDKTALHEIDPSLWLFGMSVIIQLLMLPRVFQKRRLFLTFKAIKLSPFLIAQGAAMSFANLTYMHAISLTTVAYPIALRQSNSVIVVLLSVILFKESNFRHRLCGASVLSLGAVLLAFV